jgi:hypothetical protein
VGRGPTTIRLPAGTSASIYASFDGLVWHLKVPLDKEEVQVVAVLGR